MDITMWVRLQLRDMPIFWTEEREHYPGSIADDREDTHWLVDVKMDKEMTSAEGQLRERG